MEDQNIINLKEILSDSFKIPTKRIIIVGISNFKFREILSNQRRISEVLGIYTLLGFEAPEEYDENQFETVPVLIAKSQYKRYAMQKNYSIFSFSRVLFFKKSDTCKEIHLGIFSYFIKSLVEDESQQEELLKNLQEEYEQQFIQKKDPPYNLLILNSSKKTEDKYNRVSKAPCDFCNDTQCENCVLPYQSEEKLEEMLKKIKNFKKGFQLLVVFNNSAQNSYFQLNKINNCQEHSSFRSQMPQNIEKNINLYDCFENFGKQEQLEKDNAWYCPDCKTHVEAFKKLELYRLPQILIIALKRFKSKGFFREKMTTHVDFPLDGLDLQNNIKMPSEYKDQEFIYDCFAVSNHYGGMGGGHYTAFARNSSVNKWMDYDDSSVSEVRDLSDIVSPAAYVLFYRKMKSQV